MKLSTTFIPVLLTFSPIQSSPNPNPLLRDIWNTLNPFKPNNNPPPTNPPSTNNNTSGGASRESQYKDLSDFLNPYGLDLGTPQNPLIGQSNPAPQTTAPNGQAGIPNSIASNPIQEYVKKSAEVIYKMMENPNQKYDVGPIVNSPILSLFGLLSLAPNSGIPTSIIQSNNRANSPSVRDQFKAQNNQVTIYTFVNIIVNFLSENPKIYDAFLDVGIQFLKTFPGASDTAFRIIAAINPSFNPTLTKRTMDFLYDYEKANSSEWKKLTSLLVKFLQKDNGVSSRMLRNIIALIDEKPI